MHWLRAHMPLALLSFAAILFLLGSFAATREPQNKTSPSSYPIWVEEDIPAGQSSAYSYGPSQTQALSQGTVQEERQDGGDWPFAYSYMQLFGSVAPTPQTKDGPSVAGAPLKTSVQPASAEDAETAVPKVNSFFQNAYSLIPRGLINTAAPKQKSRTPEEQELYEYGNAVGAEIQTFESAHKNATETLKNFFPEKGGFSADDPIAVAAILALAGDYSRLGGTIANISFVPESARELHIALAKSYEGVGDGLSALAKTPANGDITKAVLAYDEKADVFIKNFVALAEFFSARGIKFSASDPGSVFSFSATGGL